MQMSGGLLVVFVGDGRLDAVAAQPKVDKVVDALLAFGDATLKENNKDIKSIKHKAGIRRRDPERKYFI
jgi:hypothetical protein